MNTVLIWVNVAILGYFVVANTFYAVLLALSALELVSYKMVTRADSRWRLLQSETAPTLSILAPAHNEAATIVASVTAMLGLYYPNLEIVVVNDGSSDATVRVLIDHYDLVEIAPVFRQVLPTEPVLTLHRSRVHPNLVVVDKVGGGKADALNAGLNVASGQLVCALDADTVVEPLALQQLVWPFVTSPRQLAAGGTIRVANGSQFSRGRIVRTQTPLDALPGFQVVEYVRAFLLGRLGWNRMGGNLIVSGAFGLFDRAAMLDAGGYLLGTVGEDMEVAVRLRRRSYEVGRPGNVVFIPDPVAWTEAPTRVRQLGRQRERWQRGLADVLWRHRRVMLRPRYRTLGFIGYPYFLMVELLGPLVEVIGLLALVGALFIGAVDTEFAGLFFLGAYGYGVCLTAFAVTLDELGFHRSQRIVDRLLLMLWGALEPLGYRQMVLLFRLRGLVRYLGRRKEWGKQSRTGVTGETAPELAAAQGPTPRPPMRRPLRWAIVALVVALVASGVVAWRLTRADPDSIADMDQVAAAPTGPSWAPRPVDAGGLREVAQATPQGLHLFTAHGPVGFMSGVNLGGTTPGHLPGELSISDNQYRIWLDAMGRLGVRVVRVYTIHPPAFYDQLHQYNVDHPDAPLYLLQGVYLPDESYVKSGNLYDATVTGAFTADLHDAVGAVHGQLDRTAPAGRASGQWHSDVSEWLVGWIIGAELDPNALSVSDTANAGQPAVNGTYFTSLPGASPTERWYAARMDELATAEAAHGRTEPIAFVNWPTTDPLVHPEEPLPQEDLVGIDANHIRATANWPGGQFASYHAYPYYPDFQRHEPGLATYTYKGSVDRYAAYLLALKTHHAQAGLPVVVSEFGVPASIGSAHAGPLDRDQGDHNEQEAMRMDAELLRLIHHVGLSGGLLFGWVDEWFKFTWNTISHQIPADRRQLWHDALTNEQWFGMVAMDPTGKENPDPQDLGGGTEVADTTVRVDEGYIHLDVRLNQAPSGQVTIAANTVPDLSGPPPPGSTDQSADVAVVLDPAAKQAQLMIRQQLDPIVLDYAVPASDRPAPVNGWIPLELIVNRALVIPSTQQRLAPELFDVARLRYGTWDPHAAEFDNRSTWNIDGDTVHIRLPWAMAGLADPSSHRMLVPLAPDHTKTVDSVPISVTARGHTDALTAMTWNGWNVVGYQARLKAGAAQMQSALVDVAR